jgi:hypothetical protein
MTGFIASSYEEASISDFAVYGFEVPAAGTTAALIPNLAGMRISKTFATWRYFSPADRTEGKAAMIYMSLSR